MGINRNIVECKFRINRNALIFIAVLIETLWNVNQVQNIRSNLLVSVLIETLWNVNTLHLTKRGEWKDVLIETLWNVNEWIQPVSEMAYQRINRNIVECK